MAAALPLFAGVHHARRHPPRDEIGDLLQRCRGADDFPPIHARIIKSGRHQDSVLVFKLLRLCYDWSSPDLATSIFKKIGNPDVYHYTAMISGKVAVGSHLEAISSYSHMAEDGISPDSFVVSYALRACASAEALQEGKQIHGQILKQGSKLISSRPVLMRLLDFYGRCGDFSSARQLFDKMPDQDSVPATILISCYSPFGMVEDAIATFNAVLHKDTTCWTAMIDCLSRNGRTNEALQLFRQMQKEEQVRPNEVTLVCALSACSQLGALELGKWIHSYVGNYNIKLNLFLGSALIDMYCRCGSLEDAQKLFAKMPDRDVVCYNSMISGLAMHGQSAAAVELFHDMTARGLRPTPATFVSVLNACSHGGLRELAFQVFHSMKSDYKIEPQIEHYGCMVDLLARTGRLKEACDFIETMKMEPDQVIWCSLLGGCKLYKDLHLGNKIAGKLAGGEFPVDSGTFTLIANFYSAFGKWEESARTRNKMRRKGVAKEPGCSAIEVAGEVHEFLLGDTRHKRKREIYRKLAEIGEKVKELGYSPETEAILQDVEEGEKIRALEIHSERLAISFGLISTKQGATIRIAKNLRICNDCHAMIKIVSKVTGRKIIIRDRARFHHFQNGACSCGDFW